MSASDLTFTIEQGRTWEVYLSWRPGGAVATLTSGYTTYFQARTDEEDTAAVFAYDSATHTTEVIPGSYTFDGEGYNLRLKLSPAITDALAVQDVWVQVFAKDGSGDVYELLPATRASIVPSYITIS